MHDRLGRDVFNRLHDLCQRLLIPARDRCEGNTTVAHEDRRYAVPAAGCHFRIPTHLGVEVRMRIDEPRGDDAICRVDHLVSFSHGGVTDTGNPLVVDNDVGAERGGARTIDHHPIFDHEIVRHVSFLLLASVTRVSAGPFRVSSPREACGF